MNIKDVTGVNHEVNLIEINNEILKTVNFSASNGRVFKIGNHNYHLNDLMKAIESEKRTLSTIQISRLITVFSSADDAGYSTGFADRTTFEKKIAGVKHWISQRRRKAIFNNLVQELIHKGDPKGSKSIARHAVIGKCYLDGIGTKQNVQKAQEHLKIAANCGGKLNKGNAEAQYLLYSRFDDEGFKDFFGVNRDDLLNSAALKGHPEANYQLALKMKGKPSYYSQLKKAADLGDPYAQFDLSQSPESKDTFEGLNLLVKAANQEEPRALEVLAKSPDYQLKGLISLADTGDISAILKIALHLGQKGNDKKETDKTVDFLNRHYDLGHLTANQYNDYLEQALGVSRATAFSRK